MILFIVFLISTVFTSNNYLAGYGRFKYLRSVYGKEYDMGFSYANRLALAYISGGNLDPKQLFFHDNSTQPPCQFIFESLLITENFRYVPIYSITRTIDFVTIYGFPEHPDSAEIPMLLQLESDAIRGTEKIRDFQGSPNEDIKLDDNLLDLIAYQFDSIANTFVYRAALHDLKIESVSLISFVVLNQNIASVWGFPMFLHNDKENELFQFRVSRKEMIPEPMFDNFRNVFADQMLLDEPYELTSVYDEMAMEIKDKLTKKLVTKTIGQIQDHSSEDFKRRADVEVSFAQSPTVHESSTVLKEEEVCDSAKDTECTTKDEQVSRKKRKNKKKKKVSDKFKQDNDLKVLNEELKRNSESRQLCDFQNAPLEAVEICKDIVHANLFLAHLSYAILETCEALLPKFKICLKSEYFNRLKIRTFHLALLSNGNTFDMLIERIHKINRLIPDESSYTNALSFLRGQTSKLEEIRAFHQLLDTFLAPLFEKYSNLPQKKQDRNISKIVNLIIAHYLEVYSKVEITIKVLSVLNNNSSEPIPEYLDDFDYVYDMNAETDKISMKSKNQSANIWDSLAISSYLLEKNDFSVGPEKLLEYLAPHPAETWNGLYFDYFKGFDGQVVYGALTRVFCEFHYASHKKILCEQGSELIFHIVKTRRSLLKVLQECETMKQLIFSTHERIFRHIKEKANNFQLENDMLECVRKLSSIDQLKRSMNRVSDRSKMPFAFKWIQTDADYLKKECSESLHLIKLIRKAKNLDQLRNSIK